MKKLLIFFVLFTAASFGAIACLNGDTKTLKNGVHLYTDSDVKSFVPNGHDLFDVDYERVGKELDRLWKRTKDIDYLSDYALVLTLQKKYKEAIRIYLQIERIKPGRYSTASNLGTAYELNSENEQALKWIRRAVEINPASHWHSEWIHVKILEAKLDSRALINEDLLLNTNFGPAAQPVSKLSQTQIQELLLGLYYQLNERITLVPPKDIVVATLLFALGNLVFLNHDSAEAVIIYEKARTYGYVGPLLNKRIAAAKGWEKPAQALKPARKNGLFWFGTSGSVALLVVAWSIWRARRRRQSQ